MTVHGWTVRSPLTGCQVTSRPRDRFSRYSKWLDTFRTALVQVSLKSDKNNYSEYFARSPTYVYNNNWFNILLKMRNLCKFHNTRCTFNDSPPPPKIVPFIDNVVKYGTAGQATDDNIIQRMRFACWISKATDTHSEYVMFISFPL